MDAADQDAPPADPRVVPDRLRLPLSFDPALLLRDLTGLSAEWVAHYVRQNYSGDWGVLPLRAPAGETHLVRMIYADPTCRQFVDTALLAGCTYFREVLAAFRCPLLSVRLMRLTAGSEVKEHTDYDLRFEEGKVRLDVPVATNDGVEFYLNGRRVVMAAGGVLVPAALRPAPRRQPRRDGPGSPGHRREGERLADAAIPGATPTAGGLRTDDHF
jgi:hypothetical protein